MPIASSYRVALLCPREPGDYDLLKAELDTKCNVHNVQSAARLYYSCIPFDAWNPLDLAAAPIMQY